MAGRRSLAGARVALRRPVAAALDLNPSVGDYYGRATLPNADEFDSQLSATSSPTSTSSLRVGLGAGDTFAVHGSARLEDLRIDQAGDSTTVGRYDVNLASVGATCTF